MDRETARFISSIAEDERIFFEDLDGTEAHNIMLHDQGIITRDELRGILASLETLRSRKQKGDLEVSSEFEDIHEFIETYVIDEVGIQVGGKLHTGRSRNDQVALDVRMRVRTELNAVSERIINLIDSLLTGARKHLDCVMVLYTHNQPAQVGVFSHYLVAYADRLFRDLERLQDAYARVNTSPLGAGPIGGSSLPIDRSRTAFLLGFPELVENSIDAVSSRDFVLETVGHLAILMTGLSRIAEDFIIWSSAEVGYLEIADEYASTSSVMPQKRNPVPLELIRAKTGTVLGAHVSLLTMVKGLQTGYNIDLQETKPPVWKSFDAVNAAVEVLTGILTTLKVNARRMASVASASYAIAMDLAENLVLDTALSFREAHQLVGTLVKEALNAGRLPTDLTPTMVGDLAKRLLGKTIVIPDEVIQRVTDVRSCLSNRVTVGGSSSSEVKRMIPERRKRLRTHRKRVAARLNALEASRTVLRDTVHEYLSEGTTLR
jgi:argininosuccinate lyase